MLFKGGIQAVVLKSCIPQVMEVVDSIHDGPDRVCLLPQRSYYWDSMKGDIQKHCEDCLTCKVFSKKPKQEALALTEPKEVSRPSRANFKII